MDIKKAIYLLLLINTPVDSANHDPLDPLDSSSNVPMILTATRLQQSKLEAPLASTIIDKEFIEKSHARTITELFKIVPGFLSGSRDGRSTLVTNIGFADELARNFQVLIDGRSVWSVSVGGVPWHDLGIEIEEIERIEIIRGPNAASFGSNSFLGTINIITKHTDTTPGNYASVKAGSFDYKRVYFRHGGKYENIGYRFSISDMEDNGFEREGESEINDIDGQSNTSIKARFDLRISEQDTIDLDIGRVEGTRNDGNIPESTFDPLREKNLVFNYNKISWNRTWDTDDGLKVTYYNEYHKQTDLFTTGDITVPYLPGSITLDIDATAQWKRESLELEYRKQLTDNFRSVLGIEKRKDSQEGKIYDQIDGWDHNDVDRYFARAEWKPTNRVIINMGLMHEDITVGGSKNSPMLSATYLLDENSSIRTSLTRSYRYPVMYEDHGYTEILNGEVIFLDTTGNLKPSKADAFDIGYFKNDLGGRLQYEFRAFRMELEDLILTTTTDGINDFLNTDDATVYGIQSEVDYRTESKNTRVLGNISLQRADATDNADNVSFSVPKTNFGVTVLHDFYGGYEASIAYHYLSEMSYLNSADLPSYNRLDIGLSKNIKTSGNNDINIRFHALNLLDDHKDVRPDNDLGRLYYLTADLSF